MELVRLTVAASAIAPIFLPSAFAQDAPAREGRSSVTAWTLTPTKPGVYVQLNKPLWKLTDILAKHADKTDWAEPVVKDEDVFAQYISLGPGKKTLTSLETDTLVWFIVKRGPARFRIQGQQPFVATKDFIVQAPKRTAWSIETVGDEPSLRQWTTIPLRRNRRPDTPISRRVSAVRLSPAATTSSPIWTFRERLSRAKNRARRGLTGVEILSSSTTDAVLPRSSVLRAGRRPSPAISVTFTRASPNSGW